MANMKTILKTTGLLLTAIVLMVAAGCKKDNNGTAVQCRILKKQNAGRDTAYITYGAQGRVSSYNKGSHGSTSFTYNGLTALPAVQPADASDKITTDVSLNAQGNITFMNWKRQNASDVYIYTFAFEYDGEGHIIQCLSTLRDSGSTTITYGKDSLVWANGNLIAKYSFFRNNLEPYSLFSHIEVQYTADENKMGYHPFYYTEEPIGMLSGWDEFYHLFGKAPKNLPQGTKYFNSAGDQFNQYYYSYVLNTNGYITEENIVRSMHYPFSLNRRFEYSCE